MFGKAKQLDELESVVCALIDKVTLLAEKTLPAPKYGFGETVSHFGNPSVVTTINLDLDSFKYRYGLVATNGHSFESHEDMLSLPEATKK